LESGAELETIDPNIATFFPYELPDELTYSVFSAYQALSGMSTQAVRRFFFGANAVPDLAMVGSQLAKITRHTSLRSVDACEKWLWRHTLYPVWGTFVDASAAKAWLAQVTSGSGNGLPRGEDSSLRFAPHLATCVDCIAEDIEAHSRSYWHRSHQVYGVTHCFRHRTALSTKCEVCGTTIDCRPSFGLPSLTCAACQRPIVSNALQPISDAQARYGLLVHQILNSQRYFNRRKTVRTLIESCRNGVDIQRSVDDCIGNQFAISLMRARGLDSARPWLLDYLRVARCPSPILILAVASVTGLELVTQTAPLRDADVPSDEAVERELGRLSGSAAVRFGVVRALLKGGRVAGVARTYKVHRMYASNLVAAWGELRQRRQLRKCARPLRSATPSTKKSARSQAPKPRAAQPQPNADAIALHRSRLSETIKQNPGMSRSALNRTPIRRVIRWLQKYDCAWLEGELPARQSFGASVTAADWHQRDRAFVGIIGGELFRVWLAEVHDPGTWRLPTRLFGNHIVRDMQRGNLPLTVAALSAFGYRFADDEETSEIAPIQSRATLQDGSEPVQVQVS
jgi:TniQ/Tn7-like transposition protein D